MHRSQPSHYELARSSFCAVVGELREEVGFGMGDLPDVYAVHDIITDAWHRLDAGADSDSTREMMRASILEAAGIEIEYGQYAAA